MIKRFYYQKKKNSFMHKSFVCFFLMSSISILTIDRTLSGATLPTPSGLGRYSASPKLQHY